MASAMFVTRQKLVDRKSFRRELQRFGRVSNRHPLCGGLGSHNPDAGSHVKTAGSYNDRRERHYGGGFFFDVFSGRVCAMLTAYDIQARKRAQPFTPFRIATSPGQTYDVLHPDLVLIGKCELIVARPSRNDSGIGEQPERVLIIDITALEDLPANGKPRRKRSA